MKRLIDFLITVTVLFAILAAVALIFYGFVILASPKSTPEPTEPISWSVVEEIGRDGDEVHYRIYSSNGLTVDRYTEEVKR